MEEEGKTLYSDVFTMAEREFFKYRLQTLYPTISDKGSETSIAFPEQQKLANCPHSVHAEQRGFNWIVLEGFQTDLPLTVTTYQKRKMIHLMRVITSM